MKRGTLLAAVLSLATAGAGRAEVLVNTDFAKGAAGWVLNRDAQLLKIQRRQLLSLIQNEESQVGTAWCERQWRLSSFSFMADLRIRFAPLRPGACPADGAAMTFARGGTDAVGGGGGELALFGGPIDTFAGFEINTWCGQGLGTDQEKADCRSGKNVTFAFDWVNPSPVPLSRGATQSGAPESRGDKIGQVLPPPGMTVVNGGWYRYQWNVDGAAKAMTVYVTGLEASNRQFRKAKVLEVKFPRSPIDFEGRFGLTAATGGSGQHVEIAAVRIESPMVEPQ